MTTTHPITGLPTGKNTIQVFTHNSDGTVTQEPSFEMDWDAHNADLCRGMDLQYEMNTQYANRQQSESSVMAAFAGCWDIMPHTPETVYRREVRIGIANQTVSGKGGDFYHKGDILLYWKDPRDEGISHLEGLVSSYSLRRAGMVMLAESDIDAF